MKMRHILGIEITVAVICALIIILVGSIPALADDSTASPAPFTTTWGNSAGRTGCNATTWGKSDTTMGCSGIKNNSKCILLPCKFCRR